MFSSASNSWRSRRNSRREPSGRFSATSRPGSPATATTPPRAREEAAAEALRSLMAEQQLSQTDLLRGLALL